VHCAFTVFFFKNSDPQFPEAWTQPVLGERALVRVLLSKPEHGRSGHTHAARRRGSDWYSWRVFAAEACKIKVKAAEARMSSSHLGDFCFIQKLLAPVDFLYKIRIFKG
jgi:hypothetical protein